MVLISVVVDQCGVELGRGARSSGKGRQTLITRSKPRRPGDGIRLLAAVIGLVLHYLPVRAEAVSCRARWQRQCRIDVLGTPRKAVPRQGDISGPGCKLSCWSLKSNPFLSVTSLISIEGLLPSCLSYGLPKASLHLSSNAFLPYPKESGLRRSQSHIAASKLVFGQATKDFALSEAPILTSTIFTKLEILARAHTDHITARQGNCGRG